MASVRAQPINWLRLNLARCKYKSMGQLSFGAGRKCSIARWATPTAETGSAMWRKTKSPAMGYLGALFFDDRGMSQEAALSIGKRKRIQYVVGPKIPQQYRPSSAPLPHGRAVCLIIDHRNRDFCTAASNSKRYSITSPKYATLNFFEGGNHGRA